MGVCASAGQYLAGIVRTQASGCRVQDLGLGRFSGLEFGAFGFRVQDLTGICTVGLRGLEDRALSRSFRLVCQRRDVVFKFNDIF